MPIYHLSVKPVSRSTGRSATAAAAYRAAERIEDQRTGVTHDYARKGGVESADLVLPDHAPAWASDRAALWNAAELAEKRKDACVAREYEVALPSELPPDERRRLAVDFAKAMANREGCAVDVCIHAPGRGGDDRNHHAHLLRTTRKVEADGLGAKLDTEKAGRNRKDDLESVRAQWVELVNERLRQQGVNERIDHRSLEAQGIDREPTQHLGPAVSGLVRRGANSEVARRMGEEADARLFAAREVGRIERELDRSILDLSGDLADAITERNKMQQETERPKGVDRTGPAVQSSRFTAKPEAKAQKDTAAALPKKTERPDFESMPIETQCKAWDVVINKMAEVRRTRIASIEAKNGNRHKRREKALRALDAQQFSLWNII
jgi:ATP-dependent exoDNAse (exonuclease V) alpha subunit